MIVINDSLKGGSDSLNEYWKLKKSLPNAMNQEIINDFLLSMKLANRSQYTISDYRDFLEKFFIDMNDPYTTLTSETILQWYKTNEWHLKESTIKRRLSILSSFYIFCVQEELVERSPIKSRWYPRQPQPIPKYLVKEDIAKTRLQSETTSLRDLVLVEFMLTSGCRVGEVTKLNREDVDLKNCTARVVGKGKKIRYVHFTEKCGVLLEQYMDSGKHRSSALFVSIRSGKRLSRRGIQAIVAKIGKEAGLTTSLHPHRFRHTFATELLAKGADLSFIGDELGHSNVSTTQIYARLPKREIISMYRKFMG